MTIQLPKHGSEVVFHCALCAHQIKIKYQGRSPSAFCKSCTMKLTRQHKAWTVNRIHGQSQSPIYGAWTNMRARCNRATNPFYARYGGRGIRVCSEWEGAGGFQRFYKWSIENGYEKGLQIDRINNDGNYEPLNCRWVTPRVNARNKGNTMRSESVAIVKRMILSGVDYPAITKRFPMLTPRTYRTIKHNEKWKDIEPSQDLS